jgi:hypothetical protein
LSNSLGSTNQNTVGSSNTVGGNTSATNGLSNTAGFNNQNTAGSSNTVGSNASTTNGLSTTAGTNNQATTGQTVGNTANSTLGTTTSVANPAIEAAALGNLDFVKDLQAKGFQGYGGQQVAGFSPDQQASFGLTNAIVGNGTGDAAKGLIGQYAGAGPQNVNANSISSAMSPYMNEYVMRALAPQLAQMDIAQAKTAQATNANATGSGAFGDARTGIEQAQNANDANLQREGVIGNAYNQAFNTAIGAGAQDVSNNLSAQNANANFAETALGRALGGSNALQQLQNQQLGVAGAQNTAGQQQTAQQQAQLTAQYNQWLMAQQYPFQTAALANSTVGQASNALPVSTINTGTQLGQNVQNTAGSTIGTTGSTTANNQSTVGQNTSGTTNQSATTGTSGSTTANNQNTVGTNTSGTTSQSGTTGTTANTTGTTSNATGSSNTANASNTALSGTSQQQGNTTGFRKRKSRTTPGSVFSARSAVPSSATAALGPRLARRCSPTLA